MGDIPNGRRICGENLYAKHSIAYDNLPTYFMGFSVWNASNVCLSWDETVEWFSLLNITSVPVLYDGIYDGALIRGLWDNRNWDTSEGYVIRVADQLTYGEFKTKMAKFVRQGHVQTAKHWMYGRAVEKNNLAKRG